MGILTMTFDERYKVILQMLYKHFSHCYAEGNQDDVSEICNMCKQVKPDMTDKLSLAPVFIVPEAEYFCVISILATAKDKGVTGLSNIESLVNDILNKADFTLDIQDKIFKHLKNTEGKGYPFEEFLVMPEMPIKLAGKAAAGDYWLGSLYREVTPEFWMQLNIAVTPEGMVYCNSAGVLKPDSYELTTVEYFLNKIDKVEFEFNSKINVGYYNKALPHNAKARPAHVVYTGIKKVFINRYPKYVSKILKQPKLAYMVKGHWRKLHDGQRLGKDRHGNILFNGYTWVIAHKRGKGEITNKPIYIVNPSNLHSEKGG